eukprot:scaffold1869_cov493-Prasinococcus_capsulatus_cf.AAC.2
MQSCGPTARNRTNGLSPPAGSDTAGSYSSLLMATIVDQLAVWRSSGGHFSWSGMSRTLSGGRESPPEAAVAG